MREKWNGSERIEECMICGLHVSSVGENWKGVSSRTWVLT